MKASEIVKQLTALIAEHGDLDVYTDAEWEQETDDVEMREPSLNPWGGDTPWPLPKRFVL